MLQPDLGTAHTTPAGLYLPTPSTAEAHRVLSRALTLILFTKMTNKKKEDVRQLCLELLNVDTHLICEFDRITRAVGTMMQIRNQSPAPVSSSINVGFPFHCPSGCHALIQGYTETIVVITNRSKLGMQILKPVLLFAEEMEKPVCMVSKHGVTTFAAHSPLLCNRNVKVLTWDRVFINPFAHEMVTKHTLIPKEEVQGILQKLNARWGDLPRLKPTDACAVYMGWDAGQVVKIERHHGELFMRLIV